VNNEKLIVNSYGKSTSPTDLEGQEIVNNEKLIVNSYGKSTSPTDFKDQNNSEDYKKKSAYADFFL